MIDKDEKKVEAALDVMTDAFIQIKNKELDREKVKSTIAVLSSEVEDDKIGFDVLMCGTTREITHMLYMLLSGGPQLRVALAVAIGTYYEEQSEGKAYGDFLREILNGEDSDEGN